MRELFKKYKSVVWFLLVFVGTYTVLSLLYGIYLDYGQNRFDGVDPITRIVAGQSGQLLNEWGFNTMLETESDYSAILLKMEGRSVLLIVEGCNSISIIILFIAFILAFRQDWKKTLAFLLAGSALIYAVNLIRIVVLAIALAKYPEHQEVLHEVVFPAVIYGMVFILWLLWVRSIPKMRKA